MSRARNLIGRAPALAAALGAALGGVACEDDVLTRQRPDAGSPDTGTAAPLPLEAGMSFRWRGQITHRAPGATNEGSSVFELGLVLTSVEDPGPGSARLQMTGTGQNQLDMDWTDDRDYDLWAARLGPTRDTDQVDPAPVTVALDGPPTLPPRSGAGKTLPAPGSLFIDVRDMEAIRSAWAAAHDGRRPRVVDPDQNGGRWLLAYEGRPEPGLAFYDAAYNRREIRLEYDRRGFLVRLFEELGNDAPNGSPRATANLELTMGPD